MAVSTILSFQNIEFTAKHTSYYFRKDNILFDVCVYITLIGSLVILMKKHISRKIIQRIPKSNILPRPTDNQVRPSNEINTGDLFLLQQKYWHFLSFFVSNRIPTMVLSVILPECWIRKGNNTIWKGVYSIDSNSSQIYSDFLDLYSNFHTFYCQGKNKSTVYWW